MKFSVDAPCSLLGNASPKLTPCAALLGGLVRVKVSVVVPPGAIVVGLKALVSITALATTAVSLVAVTGAAGTMTLAHESTTAQAMWAIRRLRQGRVFMVFQPC